MNSTATASPYRNKRPLNSSEDESECSRSQSYYYVLAPESETVSNSDEDTESVYSIQDKSTDWVKDTSDTCSKCSSCTEEDIEFEVVSLSEGERFYPFAENYTTSPPDDILPRLINTGLVTKKDVAGESADDNGSEDSDSEFFKKKATSHFQFCLRCKDINSIPEFRYCIRCQKLRKEFLPPRPRRKNKQAKKISKLSALKVKSTLKELMSDNSGVGGNEVGENDISQRMCRICKQQPKDGAFVHGFIVHVYACYNCSLKLYEKSKKCPFCHTEAKRVNKLISV